MNRPRTDRETRRTAARRLVVHRLGRADAPLSVSDLITALFPAATPYLVRAALADLVASGAARGDRVYRAAEVPHPSGTGTRTQSYLVTVYTLDPAGPRRP